MGHTLHGDKHHGGRGFPTERLLESRLRDKNSVTNRFQFHLIYRPPAARALDMVDATLGLVTTAGIVGEAAVSTICDDEISS